MPAQGGAFVVFPRLHIITDSLDVVRAAVGHGPIAVQVRVKTGDRDAYQLTVAALALCRPAGALCLVDDRVGVALATGADGVHVGAEDLPVAAARRVLGPAAILGATCRDPDSARAAVADGATYLGVGPVFATGTKVGLPPPIGPEGLAAVVDAVPGTPVIAIAGITAARVADLPGYGVAAISAIAAAPASATSEFLRVLGRRDGVTADDGVGPAARGAGSAGRDGLAGGGAA
jgi:thiamine-phosphate pyrophosphorylase